MNKLFLHVGPHKTGTTALQKFLLDNQAALFKSNLVYPKRYKSIFGHHQFRELLDQESLSEDDLDFFAKNHDYLLSSEDFISLNREKFEYLRKTLETKQIQVIFSWRRASFKLYSIWQETVKHGGTETFFSYYHDHLARPGQSQMLSADLKLNMFCHVYGKENVKVLDYDASARSGSLLKDFCKLINVPWRQNFVTPEKNPDAVNRSMDIADIEVIRALNHLFKSAYGVEGPEVRVQYSKQQAALQQAGLDRLKEIIQQNKHVLTVGNYFIDNRCEQIMSTKFRDNIINYQPNSDLRQLVLAKPDWMFEVEAHAILDELAKIIKDFVKV